MFNIDYNKRQPVNEQITEQVICLALAGVIKPGDWLPSVRQLATELSINPNTIQRAYSELERRGIIVTVVGKGSFITNDSKIISEYADKSIKDVLITAITKAQSNAWSIKKFIDTANILWNESDQND